MGTIKSKMGTLKSKMGTNMEHKRKAKWARKKANFVKAYLELDARDSRFRA